MNRRGMALLLALWLIVLLSGAAMVSLGGSRAGGMAVRNRQTLLRAGWAAEACLEILLGRATRDSMPWATPDHLALDSIDLGEGIWCRLEANDPGERLQVNLASASALLILIGDSGMTRRVMRGRPWPGDEALAGFEWSGLVTTRGAGRVNLNRAPSRVLATLPGLGREGADALVLARAARRFRSVDEAVAALPPFARSNVAARYQDFLAASEVEPEQLLVTATGRVRDSPLLSRVTATLVPAGSRLAVVRRETE